jgi:hypothetical protein
MPLPLKPNRWVHSIKVIMPRKEKTFECEYRKEAIGFYPDRRGRPLRRSVASGSSIRFSKCDGTLLSFITKT